MPRARWATLSPLGRGWGCRGLRAPWRDPSPSPHPSPIWEREHTVCVAAAVQGPGQFDQWDACTLGPRLLKFAARPSDPHRDHVGLITASRQYLIRPGARCARRQMLTFLLSPLHSFLGQPRHDVVATMTILTVRHVTTYRYRRPVALGEHRMMFRPRDSYDQRLIDSRLLITPEPVHIHWIHDPFGNCVALARFKSRASELRFESTIRVDHYSGQRAGLPDRAAGEDLSVRLRRGGDAGPDGVDRARISRSRRRDRPLGAASSCCRGGRRRRESC